MAAGEETPADETEICIEAAVALPVHGTFTYRMGRDMFSAGDAVGKRVLVPFGRRRVTGYILGAGDAGDRYQTKRIIDILDDSPLFPAAMIPFFRWAADYYVYPLGEVIKCALPAGLTLCETVEFAVTEMGSLDSAKHRLTPLQKDILEILKTGSCSRSRLSRRLGTTIPPALIGRMEEAGLIRREYGLQGRLSRARTEKILAVSRMDIPEDRFFRQRKRILDAIARAGEISVARLSASLPGSSGLLNYLQANGYVTVTERRLHRDPFGEEIVPDSPPVLNSEQETAVKRMMGDIGRGFRTFLLSGVTGSGKTEVYLRLAAETIRLGYTVLVLVPEIALISQTGRRFRARFGECVAILHSGLSSGQRYDQWTLIREGKVNIVIGARSAVFAPLEKIGMVIVDEEHDGSYKQQEGGFRYNARDLAVVRAMLDGAIACLGSATPALQTTYNVDQGKYIEVRLTRRINRQALPEVAVVNLRGLRDQRGTRRFISRELHTAMAEALSRGEQVLLFLNRRGYANFPVCSGCGETLRCINCDIPLTLHKSTNAYRCHYCGYSEAATVTCRACGIPGIKALGLGTEKVEAAARALFPAAAIARLDHDTTRGKGALLGILKELKERRIDILVGTQMVAKGHDFPNITLVGIICADGSLNFPDFRSSEHTFQLLSQVSGRAGRGDQPGRVILQTYNPDHFSIQAARHQDYQLFYEQEIRFRRALRYPPFSRMIQLGVSGKDKALTERMARELGCCCRDLRMADGEYTMHLEVLGPIEAPLAKIANHYRWQILLKGTGIGPLHRFIRRLMFGEAAGCFRNRNVKVLVDVDPLYML